MAIVESQSVSARIGAGCRSHPSTPLVKSGRGPVLCVTYIISRETGKMLLGPIKKRMLCHLYEFASARFWSLGDSFGATS